MTFLPECGAVFQYGEGFFVCQIQCDEKYKDLEQVYNCY